MVCLSDLGHLQFTIYACVLDSLQLFPLSLIVAEEVSILTGMDVFMDLQQEPLTELKCLRRWLSLNKCNKTYPAKEHTLFCVNMTHRSHSHTPVETARSTARHTPGTE